MNEENLINNMDLTPSERRHRASVAGKASAKARREKKSMQEMIKLMLQMTMKKGKGITTEDLTSLESVKGKNLTVEQAIILKQMEKAMKGDTRSAEFLRDTAGEKAVKVEVETNEAVEKLDSILSEVRKAAEDNA